MQFKTAHKPNVSCRPRIRGAGFQVGSIGKAHANFTAPVGRALELLQRRLHQRGGRRINNDILVAPSNAPMAIRCSRTSAYMSWSSIEIYPILSHKFEENPNYEVVAPRRNGTLSRVQSEARVRCTGRIRRASKIVNTSAYNNGRPISPDNLRSEPFFAQA